MLLRIHLPDTSALLHLPDRSYRTFSRQLVMTIAALISAAEGHCPSETVAHVVRDHIIYAANAGQHTLGAEFLCKGYEPTFRDIYFKAVTVYTQIYFKFTLRFVQRSNLSRRTTAVILAYYKEVQRRDI